MLSMFRYLKNCIIKLCKGITFGLIGLQAYYYYPQLMLFPFMYGISIALLFIAVIGLIVLQYMTGLIIISSIIMTLEFTALVVFAVFSYVLLNIGICYAVGAYCEQKRLSFWTTLSMGLTLWRVALVWLLIIYLANISSNEKLTTSTALAFVLQMIWSLATFFIYPIIAFEDLSIFQALKRSVRIIWKNLNAMLGVSLSLGLLNNFILSMGVELSPYIITFFDIEHLTKNNGLPFLAMIAGIACFLFILFGIIGFIFMSETIIGVIIYRRIHNQPTGEFEYSQPLSTLPWES